MFKFINLEVKIQKIKDHFTNDQLTKMIFGQKKNEVKET